MHTLRRRSCGFSSICSARRAPPWSRGPMWVGRVAVCHAAAERAAPGPLASGFKGAVALHVRIEHFQNSTAGVDLVVMARSGKPSSTRNRSSFQRPRRIFTLPARHCELERPEPRQLVATLHRGLHRKSAQRAHQVKLLALAGLPRILAEPDADPLTVLGGGVEQQSLDIAQVCPRAPDPAANSRRSCRGRA